MVTGLAVSRYRVYQSILVIGEFTDDELSFLEQPKVTIRKPGEVSRIGDIPLGTDLVICVGEWAYDDKLKVRSLAASRQIVSPAFVGSVDSVITLMATQEMGGSGLSRDMRSVIDPMLPPGINPPKNLRMLARAIKARMLERNFRSVTPHNIYAYIQSVYATRRETAARRQEGRRAAHARYLRRKARLAGLPAPEPAVPAQADAEILGVDDPSLDEPVDDVDIDVDIA